jgi:hypothetical protein
MTELLDNAVKYDYSLGVGGARFVLMPLKNFHTEEDIRKAKNQLYTDHDVLSINTEWKEWSEWKDLKVWLAINSDKNNNLNVEFHKEVYEKYKISNHNGINEKKQ